MLLEDVIRFGHHFQAVSPQREALASDPLTMPGRGAQFNRVMSGEETKPKFKPLLLALALAAVLTWYVINPAPRLSHQRKLKDDLPEADPHRKETRPVETLHFIEIKPVLTPTAVQAFMSDEDLPNWPEYIEVG